MHNSHYRFRKSKGSTGSAEPKSRKSSARGRDKDSARGEKKKGKSRPPSSKRFASFCSLLSERFKLINFPYSPRGKKKSPSPAPPPEPVEEPVGPPPPEPGSPDWVYVDESLSIDLVKSLVPYWENAELSYVKNLKHTLRQIRAEREDIIRLETVMTCLFV